MFRRNVPTARRPALVCQPCNHCKDDQEEQDQSNAEEEITHRAGDALPAFPFVLDAGPVEAPFGHEAVVPAPALVQHLGLRDAAGENDRVHRELLDAEMRVEEVDREDEAGREQRLVGVEDKRDVDHPAGEEAGEEPGEPHHEARGP